MTIKVSASVLAADFLHLDRDLQLLDKAGADYLHLDVMDGEFVPNISFGQPIVKAIKSATNLPLDVHLMIKDPARYIKDFVDAGADLITIHYESSLHVHRDLSLIKSFGKKAGIAIVPSTPAIMLESILDEVDLVLVMLVNPGFGNQKLITSQFNKIKKIKEMLNKHNKDILLSVDGGVDDSNAMVMAELGVDILVAGSFVFRGESLKQQIDKLKMNNIS